METLATNFLAAFSVRYLLRLQQHDGLDIQWRESGFIRRTFDIAGKDAEQAHDFVRRWMDGPR